MRDVRDNGPADKRFQHLKAVNENDELMETQVNDLKALYDEINGDELKVEVRRLRSLMQLSIEWRICMRH